VHIVAKSLIDTLRGRSESVRNAGSGWFTGNSEPWGIGPKCPSSRPAGRNDDNEPIGLLAFVETCRLNFVCSLPLAQHWQTTRGRIDHPEVRPYHQLAVRGNT